jgi:hypothetical protein
MDIGKKSFHVVGLDQRGAIVLRQQPDDGAGSKALLGNGRVLRSCRTRRGQADCKSARATFTRRVGTRQRPSSGLKTGEKIH